MLVKQIETYEELSALASAQLRRGVKTNTIVTKEAYGAAVDQHRLRVYSEPDSLLLLQKRDGHTRMNFFLNTLADLQEPLPADTVTEIAYRPRDIGLQEAVDYWQRQSFVLLFERMRFSRPAGMAAIDSPIPVRKPAEAELETVLQFLQQNFPALTGCIPMEEELAEDIHNGRILLTEDADGITGLMHFSFDGKIGEIRHLAIREDMRGKGGTIPLLAAYLREIGEKKSVVWVRADYTAAQKAYERFGFTADGRRSAVLYFH